MKRHFSKFATLLFLMVATWAGLRDAAGQTRSLHNTSSMPPGMIGQQQLLRNPAIPGYFQAVEVLAPEGVQISVVTEGHFIEPQPVPVLLGMQVGYVYQLKVTGIPLEEGSEIYPTIELVNRLYPPEGTKLRFPVPIELTSEEIMLALKGQYVTRVVYLEDPETAFPQKDDPEHQRVIEVGPREDPLRAADRLGRPMAIIRMGSRVPDEEQLAGLGFGSPPVQLYPQRVKKPPVQPLPRATGPAIERQGQDIPRIDEPAVKPSPSTAIPITDQP